MLYNIFSYYFIIDLLYDVVLLFNRSFRDNALNFNHIIRNQVLEVHRRVIQSGKRNI